MKFRMCHFRLFDAVPFREHRLISFDDVDAAASSKSEKKDAEQKKGAEKTGDNKGPYDALVEKMKAILKNKDANQTDLTVFKNAVADYLRNGQYKVQALDQLSLQIKGIIGDANLPIRFDSEDVLANFATDSSLFTGAEMRKLGEVEKTTSVSVETTAAAPERAEDWTRIAQAFPPGLIPYFQAFETTLLQPGPENLQQMRAAHMYLLGFTRKARIPDAFIDMVAPRSKQERLAFVRLVLNHLKQKQRERIGGSSSTARPEVGMRRSSDGALVTMRLDPETGEYSIPLEPGDPRYKRLTPSQAKANAEATYKEQTKDVDANLKIIGDPSWRGAVGRSQWDQKAKSNSIKAEFGITPEMRGVSESTLNFQKHVGRKGFTLSPSGHYGEGPRVPQTRSGGESGRDAAESAQVRERATDRLVNDGLALRQEFASFGPRFRNDPQFGASYRRWEQLVNEPGHNLYAKLTEFRTQIEAYRKANNVRDVMERNREQLQLGRTKDVHLDIPNTTATDWRALKVAITLENPGQRPEYLMTYHPLIVERFDSALSLDNVVKHKVDFVNDYSAMVGYRTGEEGKSRIKGVNVRFGQPGTYKISVIAEGYVHEETVKVDASEVSSLVQAAPAPAPTPAPRGPVGEESVPAQSKSAATGERLTIPAFENETNMEKKADAALKELSRGEWVPLPILQQFYTWAHDNMSKAWTGGKVMEKSQEILSLIDSKVSAAMPSAPKSRGPVSGSLIENDELEIRKKNTGSEAPPAPPAPGSVIDAYEKEQEKAKAIAEARTPEVPETHQQKKDRFLKKAVELQKETEKWREDLPLLQKTTEQRDALKNEIQHLEKALPTLGTTDDKLTPLESRLELIRPDLARLEHRVMAVKARQLDGHETKSREKAIEAEILIIDRAIDASHSGEAFEKIKDKKNSPEYARVREEYRQALFQAHRINSEWIKYLPSQEQRDLASIKDGETVRAMEQLAQEGRQEESAKVEDAQKKEDEAQSNINVNFNPEILKHVQQWITDGKKSAFAASILSQQVAGELSPDINVRTQQMYSISKEAAKNHAFLQHAPNSWFYSIRTRENTVNEFLPYLIVDGYLKSAGLTEKYGDPRRDEIVKKIEKRKPEIKKIFEKYLDEFAANDYPTKETLHSVVQLVNEMEENRRNEFFLPMFQIHLMNAPYRVELKNNVLQVIDLEPKKENEVSKARTPEAEKPVNPLEKQDIAERKAVDEVIELSNTDRAAAQVEMEDLATAGNYHAMAAMGYIYGEQGMPERAVKWLEKAEIKALEQGRDNGQVEAIRRKSKRLQQEIVKKNEAEQILPEFEPEVTSPSAPEVKTATEKAQESLESMKTEDLLSRLEAIKDGKKILEHSDLVKELENRIWGVDENAEEVRRAEKWAREMLSKVDRKEANIREMLSVIITAHYLTPNMRTPESETEKPADASDRAKKIDDAASQLEKIQDEQKRKDAIEKAAEALKKVEEEQK